MFAPVGLRREIFIPCFGLAEATLIVTGHSRGKVPRMLMLDQDQLSKGKAEILYFPPSDERGYTNELNGSQGPQHRNVKYLMTAGKPVWGATVRIVSTTPPYRALHENEIGEIWTASSSVAIGYLVVKTLPAMHSERF